MTLKNKTAYKLIGIIVILLLLVIFTLQNSSKVEVKVFFWSKSMPSALLILISLTIGLLVGWLAIPLITQKKKKT